MIVTTFMNVDGPPTLLTIMSEKGAKDADIPGTITVVREVTDNKDYQTYAMANPGWVMPPEDKVAIHKEVPKEEE